MLPCAGEKIIETVKERVNDAGARAVIKLPREGAVSGAARSSSRSPSVNVGLPRCQSMYRGQLA